MFLSGGKSCAFNGTTSSISFFWTRTSNASVTSRARRSIPVRFLHHGSPFIAIFRLNMTYYSAENDDKRGGANKRRNRIFKRQLSSLCLWGAFGRFGIRIPSFFYLCRGPPALLIYKKRQLPKEAIFSVLHLIKNQQYFIFKKINSSCQLLAGCIHIKILDLD